MGTEMQTLRQACDRVFFCIFLEYSILFPYLVQEIARILFKVDVKTIIKLLNFLMVCKCNIISIYRHSSIQQLTLHPDLNITANAF